MTITGGQVRIDKSMIELGRTGTSPTQQVVSALKPAALSYLEVESSIPDRNDEDLGLGFDTANIEFAFKLAQKSYSLTVNCLSTLAIQRPMFFKEASVCLSRRATNPPPESDALSRTGALAIACQLRSTCLTLLRNALSISSGASSILHKALIKVDMELQAEKALKMANQAHSLKTASRATRNQALVYYEWDASDSTNRSSKRQKETDDALAKVRAAKKARGLGAGIQLPTSMSDAVELIMLNLKTLPAAPASKQRPKSSLTFDALVEAVMTNGSSLSKRGGGWYDREGGNSWKFHAKSGCVMSPQLASAIQASKENKVDDEQVVQYRAQCNRAAVAAYNRILSSAAKPDNQHVSDLSSHLAARLSFLFNEVGEAMSEDDKSKETRSNENIAATISKTLDIEKSEFETFFKQHPLVATSVSFAAGAIREPSMHSLSEALLNEALMQTELDVGGERSLYDKSLEWLVGTVVSTSQKSDDNPANLELRKAAAVCSSNLRRYFEVLPRLSNRAMLLLCGLCDNQKLTSAALQTSSRKTPQDSIAYAAATHAAKVASEKRSILVLLILRDVTFQRDNLELRKHAIHCTVGLATGRIPSGKAVNDRALKLLMNVFFPKSSSIAAMVAESILSDFRWAQDVAKDLNDEVQSANEAAEKEKSHVDTKKKFGPRSDKEKAAMEKLRKPTLVMMALSLRRPEMVKSLFQAACSPGANILARTVQSSMIKLRGLAVKEGAAEAALRVAETCSEAETPMLLSFLETLSPSGVLPDDKLVEACFSIQESKKSETGEKDPRFLIPIISSMKRNDLIERLPQFVRAEDNVLLAALVRMGDKVHRQALIYREEPDADNPSLLGLTLCEQLVSLHHVDFTTSAIPKRRYLDSIKLCLDDDNVYNDLVIKSALDHMSGMFLTGTQNLPLGFMRTILLVCTKHETLHEWICKTLLKRLVEAEIFNDKRQWEGWMRCASMFEKDGDMNVKAAIALLPAEYRLQYQSKWA